MRGAHVLTHPLAPATSRQERRHPTARVRARLRAPWLDRQLAMGAPTWCTPVHAARALQLTSDRSRRSLARSLARLVRDAEQRPVGPFGGGPVPPCRIQVHNARPLLLALSAQLRAGEPVEAAGIARLRALLCDGTGPCYARIEPDALTTALQAISQWLEVQD